jgi:hypothetical protein
LQVIDNVNGNKKVLVPVSTLEEAIKSNGDADKPISYLKVDVEGSELDSIPQWLTSDVLRNVQQIGIELHTGPIHLKDSQLEEKFGNLLKSLQVMHDKYGFRMVSYNTNGCVGKAQDKLEGRYYTYFDIVLYKPRRLEWGNHENE